MGREPDRPASQGGVVFRAQGELYFLPASIAMKVIAVPSIAPIPGAPPELRGVALVDGSMIPVVDVAEVPGSTGTRAEDAMLVCAVLGERLGLVGIDVIATGRFDAGEEAGDVKVGGERARSFDVTAVIARVRESRWAV